MTMASSRLYDEAELGTSRLIGRLDIHIPMPRGAKPPPVRRPLQAEAGSETDAPERDTEAGH